MNHQVVLKRKEPDRILYLAILSEAHQDFFQSEFAQVAIGDHGLRLIVHNPVQEIIDQWIN